MGGMTDEFLVRLERLRRENAMKQIRLQRLREERQGKRTCICTAQVHMDIEIFIFHTALEERNKKLMECYRKKKKAVDQRHKHYHTCEMCTPAPREEKK